MKTLKLTTAVYVYAEPKKSYSDPEMCDDLFVYRMTNRKEESLSYGEVLVAEIPVSFQTPDSTSLIPACMDNLNESKETARDFLAYQLSKLTEIENSLKQITLDEDSNEIQT